MGPLKVKAPETTHTTAIGQKTAIWLPATNKYVLAAPPVDAIVKRIAEGRSTQEVVEYGVATLGLPEAQAAQLESQAREQLSKHEGAAVRSDRSASAGLFANQPNAALFSEKYYRVMGRDFRVEYASAETEFIVHPKFAHLETPPLASPDHRFTLHHRHGHYLLQVNGYWIGAWPEKQAHVFSGQFSMQLLEKAYRKTNDEWMAVFHAAGVSNGKDCLLFAGNSGAGKSTLSALLMSRGLDVLADDFLPVEGATGQVCRFPAAVSLKKQAVDLLLPTFPELGNAKTYHYPAVGKTVRYLSAERDGEARPAQAACRGLVFVSYQPDSGCHIEGMPPEDAFAQLVPDAWIHPSRENAQKFLEWFSRLPCYRLDYSDNERMVQSVKDLLDGLA